ncbi:MAG: hypothetical protein K6T28_06885 [Acidothermus sp.]|nr:hypothetical protein [Acidothermus sp.]
MPGRAGRRMEAAVADDVAATAGGPRPGGNRRLDRVLSPEYLDGLRELPIEEVRRLRKEAEQEEADLSYLRRLLQGRVDIIEAELARRQGELNESTTILEELPRILADDDIAPRGLGRHLTVGPSRITEHRRFVERLIADSDLSALAGKTSDQLRETLARFVEQERAISEQRRAVQAVIDACAAELARRYRDGEADVDALLQGNDPTR